MTNVASAALKLILIVIAGCVAWAQPPSRKPSPDVQREQISLGSVQLYLGESKTETLASLVAAGYSLKPIDDKAQFTVTWQSGTSLPVVLGSIGFASDFLHFVNKNWAPEDPEQSSEYELARVIFLASQSLTSQGCESVHLSTETNDQRGGRIQSVVLRCDDTHRRFQVTALDLDGTGPLGKHKAVSLSEILQLRVAP